MQLSVAELLTDGLTQGLRELYQFSVDPSQVLITPTKKEFTGDFTVVVFPFSGPLKTNPELVGSALGKFITDHYPQFDSYNVIKGFLNLTLTTGYWKSFLAELEKLPSYGTFPPNHQKVLVEFSSPNTNKPLHLGHIRNILLGWSIYKILVKVGYDAKRVQIINDRGIAICKSMLAWKLYAKEATPESTDKKPDHFVGDFYVLFEVKFQEEYDQWLNSSEGFTAHAKPDETLENFKKRFKNDYFNHHSLLGEAARKMLLDWEAGEPGVLHLWNQLNQWVYTGFEETYRKLGVAFDQLYYESNTYLLGKNLIDQGLQKGVFYKKDDGSVWVDLTEEGQDEKLLLRSDGTSVYITQDLGTADLRYQDFGADKMIYVVADEQNYHFETLFKTLKKLDVPYADGLYHLSYGMIDLPTGKMKSREGKVVDADDLMQEVIDEATKNSKERGSLEDLTPTEQQEIFRKIGLAALKFFIIKVNPKKRMVFNPEESVDLQGQTGPYVQNAYVRIQSVLKRFGKDTSLENEYSAFNEEEKALILSLYQFPEVIQTAARELDPSAIANYCYQLAKQYHKFYHDHSILNADSADVQKFRIQLSACVARVLADGMELLGIEMPDKM
jgi:arginyl-tRNA synthetase